MGAVGPTTCWPRFRLLVRVSTGPPCTEGRELDFPTRPSHFRSTGCCVAHHRRTMVTILDKRPRHPEKAHKPDTPVLRKPDWIRVRVPAASPQFAETRNDPARAWSQHGVRGGRLPQHRRVLGAAARHHDDHGRHVHARLRLLQRAHGPAGRARPARARQRGARRSPSSGSRTSSSRRSTAMISPTVGPSISPRPSAPSARGRPRPRSRC